MKSKEQIDIIRKKINDLSDKQTECITKIGREITDLQKEEKALRQGAIIEEELLKNTEWTLEYNSKNKNMFLLTSINDISNVEEYIRDGIWEHYTFELEPGFDLRVDDYDVSIRLPKDKSFQQQLAFIDRFGLKIKSNQTLTEIQDSINSLKTAEKLILKFRPLEKTIKNN